MFAKLPHCSTEGQSLATARLFQCESDNLKEEPVEPLDCKNQERLYWQTAFPVYSEGCLVHIATAAGSKLSKLITGQQILLKASWPRRVHRGQIQASRAFFFFFFSHSSMSIASSLVGEDAKTKFLSKMGQLTTSGAMLANVFQRKKWLITDRRLQLTDNPLLLFGAFHSTGKSIGSA